MSDLTDALHDEVVRDCGCPVDREHVCNDLRAAVEGLPWNVTDDTDDPEWAVGEYRAAVLALIPEGAVLATETALAEALHEHWLDSVELEYGSASVFAVCSCGEWVSIPRAIEPSESSYEFTKHCASASIARLRGEPPCAACSGYGHHWWLVGDDSYACDGGKR